MKTFSIRSAFKFGFKMLCQRAGFYLLAMLVFMLEIMASFAAFVGLNWPAGSYFISNMPAECKSMMIEQSSQGHFQICADYMMSFFSNHWILYGSLFFLSLLVIIAVGCYIILGWLNAFLRIVDYNKVAIRDLFVSCAMLVSFILASILFGCMVFGGFMLFIIPGIYLGIKFNFFGYAMIDRKLGAIDSLRASSQITNGAKGKMLLFGIAAAGLSLAMSTIALIIGHLFGAFILARIVDILSSLVVYFVVSGAHAYVYRTLEQQTFAPQAIEPSIPL